MSHSHTVLLVEDEAEPATTFRELLMMLGYEVVHAPSLEEAREIAAVGGFCAVVMDLQILMTRVSIKPAIDAGLLLFKELRAAFPRRGPEGAHLLPIIVMSGHAKDHHYITAAFRSGADDFLIKPVTENRVPLGDVLRDVLRRAGRAEHGDCAHVGAQATRAASTLPPAAPSVAAAAVAAPITIAIPGTIRGRRASVLFNGEHHTVTRGSFIVLLGLVDARLRSVPWVSRVTLGGRGDAIGGYKGVSALESELGVAFTDNDRDGNYCLLPHVALGAIDVGYLVDHDDKRLQGFARSIARALERPKRARA